MLQGASRGLLRSSRPWINQPGMPLSCPALSDDLVSARATSRVASSGSPAGRSRAGTGRRRSADSGARGVVATWASSHRHHTDRGGSADHRVGIHEQRRCRHRPAGGDEGLGGTWSRNSAHSAGKKRVRMHRQPVDVATVPVLTAASDEGADPLGMTLGIGHAEHRTPREPEHDPAIDAELLHGAARCRARGDPYRWLARCTPSSACMRGAATSGPLVEEHGTVSAPSNESRAPGVQPAPRPTVEVHDRNVPSGCPPARRRRRARHRRRCGRHRMVPATAWASQSLPYPRRATT